jgi:hypothetical protein
MVGVMADMVGVMADMVGVMADMVGVLADMVGVVAVGVILYENYISGQNKGTGSFLNPNLDVTVLKNYQHTFRTWIT